MRRTIACGIAGLVLGLALACTKTERSNEINSSPNSASSLLTTLEPSTPAGAPGSVASVDSCNIELLNGAPPTERPLALQSNGPLRLEGWVVDPSNLKNAPEHVFMILQGVAS